MNFRKTYHVALCTYMFVCLPSYLPIIPAIKIPKLKSLNQRNLKVLFRNN